MTERQPRGFYDPKLPVILKAHTGPMFSGKTAGLSVDIFKAMLVGMNVKVFSPVIDTRGRINIIKAPNGAEIETIPLESISDIYKHLDGSEDLVAIDEVQFFIEEPTVFVINDLLKNHNVPVYVAGLDMDCLGKPFGAVPFLLAMADEIVKYKAVCIECGQPAIFEFKRGNIAEDEEIIDVGGIDKYIPLCRSCFYEKSEE